MLAYNKKLIDEAKTRCLQMKEEQNLEIEERWIKVKKDLQAYKDAEMAKISQALEEKKSMIDIEKNLIKEQQELIVANWKKLEEMDQKLEKERNRIYEINKSGEKFFHLNLRGTPIKVSQALLCKYPDTVLEAMFSDRNPLKFNEKGELELDNDPNAFNNVLKYLFNGKDEPIPVKDLIEKEDTLNEFDFWGVSGDFKWKFYDDLVAEHVLGAPTTEINHLKVLFDIQFFDMPETLLEMWNHHGRINMLEILQLVRERDWEFDLSKSIECEYIYETDKCYYNNKPCTTITIGQIKIGPRDDLSFSDLSGITKAYRGFFRQFQQYGEYAQIIEGFEYMKNHYWRHINTKGEWYWYDVQHPELRPIDSFEDEMFGNDPDWAAARDRSLAA